MWKDGKAGLFNLTQEDLEIEDIQACLAFAALAVNAKGSLEFPFAA